MVNSRVLSALCLIGLVFPFPAAASEPSRDELVEQIRALQARVEQLETSSRSTADPRDVDRTIDRVLEDARRRSQLLMQDATSTAGFDLSQRKFFIRSADGNFLLAPGYLMQVRHVTNLDTSDDDDVQNGFEIRRMRLIALGHVFTPDLTYRFQWESNLDGGNVFLQDAFARYAFAEEWFVQLGQFYDVVFHEQSMLDPFVMGADRSLVNALIGGGQTDRIQGVMLEYDALGAWRGQVVMHDGYNTDNTPFTETGGGSGFLGVTNTNWGASARLEHFFAGTRRAYEDFTALGTDQDLLVLGAGASYTQSGDSDIIFHTVDLQYENEHGCSGYLALLGVHREIGDDSAVPAGSYFDWGGLVQGAYFFTEKLEGFARYTYTRLDDDAFAAGTEQEIHELTIGGVYYFARHNVRFTLEGSWLPNGAPINVGALGYVAGDDDQFVLRAQFQLLI